MSHEFSPDPLSGWSLNQRNPQVIQTFMPLWEWFYRYYFRVQTSGWNHIPAQGNALFVGSHNGGLAAPDMFMMIYDWFRHFGLERPMYGLMHPHVWKAIPNAARLAVQVGALVAHPKMAIAALQQGANVLVYPGGAKDVFRPHTLRNQIYLGNNTAYIKLALAYKIPIIPAISHGAHDTLIVLADVYDWVRQFHEWGMPWVLDLDPEVFPIYLGLPWGVAIGPLPNLPLPVQIHTHVGTPIWFERYGPEAVRDRAYVEACHQHVITQMQAELDALIHRANLQPPWLR